MREVHPLRPVGGETLVMHEERTGGVRARHRDSMHRLTSEPERAPEKRKRQFLTPRGERLTCNAHGTTLFTVASRPQPRRVRRARDARPTLARYRGRTDTAYSGKFAVRCSMFGAGRTLRSSNSELRTSNVPYRSAGGSAGISGGVRAPRASTMPRFAASVPPRTHPRRRHAGLRLTTATAMNATAAPPSISRISPYRAGVGTLAARLHATCRRLPGFNGPFTLHHSGYEPRSLVGAKHSSAKPFPSSGVAADWPDD